MSDTITAEKPATADSWSLGPIIDADAHIDPPYDMWTEYLPANLADRAPVIEEGEEHDWVVFEGNRRPLKLINNQAGREGKHFKMVGRKADIREAWNPKVRLADMDQDGIEAAVLFGGGPLPTFDSDLYIASFHAYSHWVQDFCAAAPERLQPIGYVPMRDIDETIEHCERLAKMGFTAINLPAFPQNPDGFSTSATVKAINAGQGSALTGDPKGDLQYYQPEFDRLWAKLVELNLAITFHLGARIPRFGDKQHFLPDMPMSKFAMAETIGIFIFNGIFDRFPDLKIATVESGVGWFAFYAEYADRTWEKQRFWTECPAKEKPSFYMDRNVYGSFIQDRCGVLNRDLPGAKNIMWSSDYPHSETTFPRSREVILRDFDGVPTDDVRDIICNRAKDFFRM